MRGTDGQTTHVMNAGLVPLVADRAHVLIAATSARASCRFFEFFTAQIGFQLPHNARARKAVTGAPQRAAA
jgi:hypothetical protein